MAKKSTAFLEKGLAEARMHWKKVLDLLKVVPPTMAEEYDSLSDREAKLSALVKQLVGQIAAREGGK